jgi:hypothetical protein
MQTNSRTNISLRVKQKLSVLVSIGMAGCMQSMGSILKSVTATSGLASILRVFEVELPGWYIF